MADEDMAVDPGLASPATEAPAEVAAEQPPVDEPVQVGVDAGADEGGDPGEPAAAEDEDDDLDFGFQKYRVPKSLKKAVEDLRADATRKTQAASAQRKELEDRAARIEQQSKATDAELDARAEMRMVSSELERLKEYNYAAYQAHYQQDPYQAQQVWAYVQDLHNRKSRLSGQIESLGQQRTAEAQQELAKRVQETLSEAPKIVPNWTNETAQALLKSATDDFGLTDAEIQQFWSPRFLKLIHRAQIGEGLVRKQATARLAPAVPPAQPTPVVTGRATAGARRSLADASMDEYVAIRKQQMKQRA